MSDEKYNPDFNRKIDKSKIPVCKILGVNIAAINMQWLLDFTEKNIKELSGDYMTVANVHTTVTAYEDEKYRAYQNGGIMAIPDGAPLSKVGKKRGCAAMERTTGPTFMLESLKKFADKGYSHFFFGSTDETLKLLSEKINKMNPDIKIAGMYSPPYKKNFTDEDNAEFAKIINAANADFVWVGLGAPKQEEWMAKNQGRVHGFMVGVGAGFDFLSGNIKRAPQWMQDHSLEWLYRLMQDPKKLFMRYFTTNPKFIWNAYIRNK